MIFQRFRSVSIQCYGISTARYEARSLNLISRYFPGISTFKFSAQKLLKKTKHIGFFFVADREPISDPGDPLSSPSKHLHSLDLPANTFSSGIFLILFYFLVLLFCVIERHASVTAWCRCVSVLQVLRTHAERSQILRRVGGGGGKAASEKEEDGHRTTATQTVGE